MWSHVSKYRCIKNLATVIHPITKSQMYYNPRHLWLCSMAQHLWSHLRNTWLCTWHYSCKYQRKLTHPSSDSKAHGERQWSYCIHRLFCPSFLLLQKQEFHVKKTRAFPVFLQSFFGMDQISTSLGCIMSDGLTFNIVVWEHREVSRQSLCCGNTKIWTQLLAPR